MLGINNKKDITDNNSKAPINETIGEENVNKDTQTSTLEQAEKPKDETSKKSKKKPLLGKKKTKEKPKKQPDGPIKKLKREDLLLLLKESMEENERLKAEVARLEEELSKRDIEILNAGSIAKAALELNGVFEAAQKAAEQYLENVKRIVDENVKY